MNIDTMNLNLNITSNELETLLQLKEIINKDINKLTEININIIAEFVDKMKSQILEEIMNLNLVTNSFENIIRESELKEKGE